MPAATPVTVPVDEPTEAIDAALLAHVPPDTVLASVDVAVPHILVVPVIDAGSGLMVTCLVA